MPRIGHKWNCHYCINIAQLDDATNSSGVAFIHFCRDASIFSVSLPKIRSSSHYNDSGTLRAKRRMNAGFKPWKISVCFTPAEVLNRTIQNWRGLAHLLNFIKSDSRA